MSALCWLAGHKWSFSRSVDEIKHGRTWKVTNYFQTSHCQRCGKENPMWLGSAEKFAATAINAAKADR